MIMRFEICPVCEDNMTKDDSFRFGMCLQCFTDEVLSEIGDGIVRDFISENRDEFDGFVAENYI